MFLESDDGVIDLDLDLLRHLLQVVDEEISRVDAEADASADPDAMGIYDRGNGLVGLGFVACQQYLNATWPQITTEKGDALAAGPKHPTGISLAQAVNAAANLWKHEGEWMGETPSKDEKRTRSAVDKVHPSSGDYVVSNVLYELVKPQPVRFASLLPRLEEWRNSALREARLRGDPVKQRRRAGGPPLGRS